MVATLPALTLMTERPVEADSGRLSLFRFAEGNWRREAVFVQSKLTCAEDRQKSS